jgi:hypothetical protein
VRVRTIRREVAMSHPPVCRVTVPTQLPYPSGRLAVISSTVENASLNKLHLQTDPWLDSPLGVFLRYFPATKDTTPSGRQNHIHNI